MAGHKSVLSQWRSESYDGIKGVLPKWFPDHSRKRFEKIQEELCKAVASGEMAYDDLHRELHRYATGPAIAQMFAGPVSQSTTNLLHLGLLLRSDNAERKSVGNGLRLLPVEDVAEEFRIGKASIQGSRDGLKKVWGSPDQLDEQYRLYQEDVDRRAKENPRFTRTKINTLTADKFGVSARTIARHTTNPKKI